MFSDFKYSSHRGKEITQYATALSVFAEAPSKDRSPGEPLGKCSRWVLRGRRQLSGEQDKWKVPERWNNSEISISIVLVLFSIKILKRVVGLLELDCIAPNLKPLYILKHSWIPFYNKPCCEKLQPARVEERMEVQRSDAFPRSHRSLVGRVKTRK